MYFRKPDAVRCSLKTYQKEAKKPTIVLTKQFWATIESKHLEQKFCPINSVKKNVQISLCDTIHPFAL